MKVSELMEAVYAAIRVLLLQLSVHIYKKKKTTPLSSRSPTNPITRSCMDILSLSEAQARRQ